MKIAETKRVLTLPDYTVWPSPAACDRLEHTLRYGKPTEADRMHAASVVAAYYALTTCTGDRRAQIARWLKAAMKNGHSGRTS